MFSSFVYHNKLNLTYADIKILESWSTNQKSTQHQGLRLNKFGLARGAPYQFCCKECQRLNYLHHEDAGIRGMGHKHLCPVFKAYAKRKKNTDASKHDHLERKFRRACTRFLIGTLQSVGKKRVKSLVTFTTTDRVQ